MFRAVVHPVGPHWVLVRWYLRVGDSWRLFGSMNLSRAEWQEFETRLTGVVVFEGVGTGIRRAK